MSDDLGMRVGQLYKLKDKIKKLEDEHKAAMKPYADLKDALENHIMAQLNTHGLQNIKTDIATAYKMDVCSASIGDAELFRQYVITNEHWNLIDWRADKTAVQNEVDENGRLPPGVNYSVVTKLGLRKTPD